jgi:hypothetical protein
MLTLLSMALAGEDLPDEQPLSAALLIPAADDGPLVAGAPITLILSLRNPAPVPVILSPGDATIRLLDGELPLRARWSDPVVRLSAGGLAALFGRITLEPGTRTLRLWLSPSGEGLGEGEPAGCLTVTVEALSPAAEP